MSSFHMGLALVYFKTTINVDYPYDRYEISHSKVDHDGSKRIKIFPHLKINKNKITFDYQQKIPSWRSVLFVFILFKNLFFIDITVTLCNSILLLFYLLFLNLCNE